MEVVIAKNYDEMSKIATNIIRDQILKKPNSVLGLATGGTPVGTYKELVRMHKQEGLDFSKVITFNLDEYLGIPDDHPERYMNFMKSNLFNQINIRPDAIHVPTNIWEHVEEFCQWYEDEIDKAGGIDLQLLGIGPDGHIAFNEPTSSFASRTRVKTLDESTIKANARFFNNDESKVPKYAVTMGVGTILEAKTLLLLANGKKKAGIVAQFIEGPITSMITASALQLHPKPIVVLDEDSASDLKLKDYFKWVYSNKPKKYLEEQ